MFKDSNPVAPSPTCAKTNQTEERPSQLPGVTRKIAIRTDKPPPLSSLEIKVPSPPIRRRKKSQKTSDEGNLPHSSSKNSDFSPHKDSTFSSNSFQAGIEKLGSLARRFSRDNPISNLTSPSRKSSDAIRPYKDASRRSSAIQTENSQPVVVLDQDASASPTGDDVSFC